jgi:SAM-dependent methyltransferase
MKGLPRGAHITRYYMYEHLRRVGRDLDLCGNPEVLCISRSKALCDLLNLSRGRITEADYPEYNILDLEFADGSFDFLLSDQVLEHVEGDPQTAFDESWRVLRPGGIVLHTTCFINPIHGSPGDYWRFSPDALKLLGRKFSRIIDCGGWGNFDAWLVIRDGLRFHGIPHAKWHPLHRIATKNDSEWPIVTCDYGAEVG